LDGHFVKGADSYRAYKFGWHGQPTGPPAVAVRRAGGGRVMVYASWNGATNVLRWQVLTGATSAGLKPVATAERTGFETVIELRTKAKFFAVQALSASGTLRPRSRAVSAP